jgi:hypothetical protein
VKRGYIELREKGKSREVPVGGVGFVFDGQSDEHGLVFAGVDFDSGAFKGGIRSFSAERVKRLGSYVEASVSGTGLHVILKAHPLPSGISHNGIELYTSGRFFTMTGMTGTEARPIVAAPAQFAALAEELQAQIRTDGKNNLPAEPVPENDARAADAETDTWFGKLPPEKQKEVIRYAALHIAKNSKLFELTDNGGNYQEYVKLTLALSRSGVADAENIFVEAASTAKDADTDEALRNFFKKCEDAQPRTNGVTVGTLFHMAAQCGADFSQWKQIDHVSLDDFYAYMPMHTYIFVPSREMWPGSSINARLGSVSFYHPDGTPVLEDGQQKKVTAAKWLDQNKPVEQMTWAPGLPMVIQDRLVAEGGWIERPGASCFNLYLPPTIEPGNAAEADPWLDHIHKVFGKDGDHIVVWLAHRVRRPQEKINHALVLGGNQGIGKDTLLEPVKHAVGAWNFSEVSPQHLIGRFNGFLKSTILRVSEARDLGEVNRYSFYDHMKAYTAAPPDVLRVDEKNLKEHSVINCCGVIITTNYKSNGIYLPADDRRHYVAFSDLTKSDFVDDYWNRMWGWYADGGIRHVAAYLNELDLSAFDPKAPPPKTAAFWAIVDANRAPEDAELADALDKLGNPEATTIDEITNKASSRFVDWLLDRKNRRAIPHRLESCGYVPVRNDAAKDGLWKIKGARQAIYAKAELSVSDRLKAASALTQGE